MSKEVIGTDINGKPDFTLPFPVKGARTTLAANIEQTYQAPAGFNRVFFSYAVGTNVFVGTGSDAISLPSGSFAESTTELNPGGRQLKSDGSETLRFICETASYVQLRFDQGGN